ncbi:MAG: DUF2062 domain-containing protein [Chitinophagales bacterium]
METESNYRPLFRQLRCCVLLPTYNNAGTIAAVLQDVLRYTSEVCVVNDGSTDNTAAILSQFPQIKLHSYAQNRGKGWALRQGFEFARQQGYDFAITIDSDGQHFADDLPTFLKALQTDKHAIFIGARNMDQSAVPGKSSFGNKFSNFWFRLETGIDMPDTQSGYRLYPLRDLQGTHFLTVKYEFEIEVLVRAAWKNIGIKSVPVKVYYPPAEERVSHFRPFRDFSRISVLNTVLVLITFLYIKPRNFFRYFQKKSLREILNEHLIRSHEPPLVKALSVATGVFFGIAPFWGLQMVLVYAITALFRLNKALALICSNISIPPMIPFILYGSYVTGGLWLHGASNDEVLGRFYFLEVIHDWMQHAIERMQINDQELSARIVKNLWQYILGSLTLAGFSALISGVVTYIFVKRRKSVYAEKLSS